MKKYCVNCSHFSPKAGDDIHEFARCAVSTAFNPISLVTGLPKYAGSLALPYAEVMRLTGADKCGPEALFFLENTNV
jgi:hypothetical protein